MAIPWHRFLKIGLRQLFRGTCFEVRDEFDLSDQKQLVDFVVLRREDIDLPMPDPAKMPDGFENLHDHNLLSYKSMNEAFDRYALIELIGHVVAYSKLTAPNDWREFSNQLGVFAISTRKPSTKVISKLLHETEQSDVFEIDFAGVKVRCIVINQAPPTGQNWLWRILRGDKSRWKPGKISDMLREVHDLFEAMEVLDPEIEKFENELMDAWLADLPPEKRMMGLSDEQRLAGVSAEQCLAGLSAEELEKLKKLLSES